MKECPGCGAPLKFDIASQKMLCDYCNTTVEPEEIDSDEAKMEDLYETTVFTCPRCGGNLSGDVNEASVFCPYCGNSTLLEGRLSKLKRPKSIIPFKITKEECIHSYRQFLKHSLYAPESLRKKGVAESFRGIYMPYWYYRASQKTDFSVQGYLRNKEDKTIVDSIYNINFDLDVCYDNIFYDASEMFNDQLSLSIAPYKREEQKEFSPGYMSGFYADTYDVDKSNFKEQTENFAVEETFQRLKESSLFRGYNILDQTHETIVKRKLNTKVETSELSMVPVWFMSYRYKDRLAYTCVNGQTGKAAGMIPTSPLKYILFSLLTTLPIFLLVNVLTFTNPQSIMLYANILSLFVYLIYDREILLASFYEYMGCTQRFNDGVPVTPKNSWLHKILWYLAIGAAIAAVLMSGAEDPSEYPIDYLNITVSAMILILAIGSVRGNMDTFIEGRMFGVLPIPIGTVHIALISYIDFDFDALCYLLFFVQIIACCLTFVDLIYYHNVSATEPMPQFQRKGGEDHANA